MKFRCNIGDIVKFVGVSRKFCIPIRITRFFGTYCEAVTLDGKEFVSHPDNQGCHPWLHLLRPYGMKDMLLMEIMK